MGPSHCAGDYYTAAVVGLAWCGCSYQQVTRLENSAQNLFSAVLFTDLFFVEIASSVVADDQDSQLCEGGAADLTLRSVMTTACPRLYQADMVLGAVLGHR